MQSMLSDVVKLSYLQSETLHGCGVYKRLVWLVDSI